MNAYDTIEMIVTEAPIAHRLFDHRQRKARAEAIVDSVGLPTEVIRKRPGQLSGGQLQRVAIGRALALEPELLVCDEVTSALDVSVQAQILNLLHEVQLRTQVAYLFISHDLHVVKHISDSIAVMFAGRFVETGSAQITYANPQHPYTRQLVGAAIPALDAGGAAADLDEALAREGTGCSYVAACPLRQQICLEREPALAMAPSGTSAACHVVAPADPEIAARTSARR